MPCEPALRRLQHKPNVARRSDDRVGVLCMQIADFLDCPFGIDVSRREWQGAILHPEGCLLSDGERKEHPLIFPKICPEHHSCSLLLRIEGKLHVHFFWTDPKLH